VRWLGGFDVVSASCVRRLQNRAPVSTRPIVADCKGDRGRSSDCRVALSPPPDAKRRHD
jgi:hypothetical protein